MWLEYFLRRYKSFVMCHLMRVREMMSVQLVMMLGVHLTSVALDEGLVVGLVWVVVPDVLQEVRLVGLELLLLLDVINTV